MYSAKQTACGRTNPIEIFQNETKVGQFERNYDGFGVETFAEFRRGNDWYALYSPSYVAISVMKLPSCEEIGSENKEDGFGFCPVEIYIPQYQIVKDEATPPEKLKDYPEQNHHWLSKDRYEREYDSELWEPDQEVFYEDFAFVAGCVWGDDMSWKIELRDISEAHNGIIKPVPDWGYYPMARSVKCLKDAIHLRAWDTFSLEERPALNITMDLQKTVRLQKDGTLKEFD